MGTTVAVWAVAHGSGGAAPGGGLVPTMTAVKDRVRLELLGEFITVAVEKVGEGGQGVGKAGEGRSGGGGRSCQLVVGAEAGQERDRDE
jgi:hypothetical protein